MRVIRYSLTCWTTDISMENPRKFAFWGTDSPFTLFALLRTVIGKFVLGIGEGNAGGVRVTLLYAARFVIQLVDAAEVAAAAASVVDDPPAGIVMPCWPYTVTA